MFCTEIYILTVSEHFLHGVVSGVNDDDQDESHTGGDEGSGQEVGDGPEGDHARHLGVEAGGSSNQAGDHEGKNHQLEKSHEELARVGDDGDGGGFQLIVAESQASQHTYTTDDKVQFPSYFSLRRGSFSYLTQHLRT